LLKSIMTSSLEILSFRRSNCHAAAIILTSFLSVIGAAWIRAEPSPPNDDAAKSFTLQMQAGQLTCPLDVLTQIPEVWSLTADRLDAAFAQPKGITLKENPYFQWLTTSRDRAFFNKAPYSNLQIDLKLFGADLSAEEVVVDFLDGKLNGITFSLYNRGDSGEISADEFQRRFKLCGKKMSEMLQVRPSERKADPAQGLVAEGWAWTSTRGMAMLEYNPAANQGKVEFLRLRIAPRDTKGVFAAAFQGRAMTAKLSDLPLNVKKSDSGDVFINGIPMVDQGQKGYCVVATTQRLFEYYGIPADQHQIAQAAGTDAKSGTSSLTMAEVLGKIDYRFKTHFKILGMSSNEQLVEVDAHKMTVGKRVSEAQFSKEIRRYIDSGIPLLWGLDLGKYPEEPPISKQASGGHMRMIIGYNDKAGYLLFSDSWGAGHEMKRMTVANAYSATHGLFAMLPTVH
jgi:hypothetical protein